MADPCGREARSAAQDEVSWSTWPHAFKLVLTGRTRRPALRIALIVGTLLTLFYQGGALCACEVDAEAVARLAIGSATASAGPDCS